MNKFEEMIKQEIVKADQVIAEAQQRKAEIEAVQKNTFFKRLVNDYTEATPAQPVKPSVVAASSGLVLSKSTAYTRTIDMACDILYRNPTCPFDQVRYGAALTEAGHVDADCSVVNARKRAMGFGGRLANASVAARVAWGVYQISQMGKELIDAASGNVSAVLVFMYLREGTKVEQARVAVMNDLLTRILVAYEGIPAAPYSPTIKPRVDTSPAQ